MSKTGLPCLWESGGGDVNTGHALLITDEKGGKKTPIYIKTYGDIRNKEHALIPIQKGDNVVYLFRGRNYYYIEIREINEIDTKKKTAEYTVKHIFKNDAWDAEIDECFKFPINAAKKKSNDIDCKTPYYVIPIKQKIKKRPLWHPSQQTNW